MPMLFAASYAFDTSVCEAFVVSTCNRTELYGAGDDLSSCVEEAKHFLSEYSNTDLSVFQDKLYVLKQAETVELFDLARDPYETRNLAVDRPDKLVELRARYDALARQAALPLWHDRPSEFHEPAVWGENE